MAKYLWPQDKPNCDTLNDDPDDTNHNETSDTRLANGDVKPNIDEIDAFLTERQDDDGEGLWMKLNGKLPVLVMQGLEKVMGSNLGPHTI